MSINAVSSSIPTPAAPARTAAVARAPAAPAQAPAPAPAPDPVALRDAVASANKVMQALSNSLEFSLDPESGKTMVRVIDGATQQVIRQIPSEEMMSIARALDRLQGLLLNRKA
jgi:flagellar protein FlaG